MTLSDELARQLAVCLRVMARNFATVNMEAIGEIDLDLGDDVVKVGIVDTDR